MARIQVGLPELGTDIAKYAAKFDMVELRPTPGATPRPGTLRSWRKAVNPAFTFSVVLPPVVGALAMNSEMDAALDEALAVATTVEARCIVLATSAEVRPTNAAIEKLKAVVGRLPRPSVILAWEPAGIWERAEVISLCKQLALVPVFDAAQTPLAAGPSVYTRLRSLGAQSQISERSMFSVAEQLAGRREAFVVVEHKPSALRVKKELGKSAMRVGPSAAPPIVRPSPGRLRAEDEEQ